MRSMLCTQSWYSFDDPYRHLLLMMDFYCPLAFCHKKGEDILVLSTCRVFVFRGRAFFGWLELVKFRLYLGASHCTLSFLALAIFLLGYSC